jgi:hypothetical protein
MDEIEAAYPDRHAGDGTVASKTHDQNSPNSDHRPYPYTGPGTVNAVDVGEVTEDDGLVLFSALAEAKDNRFRYAIHEGKSLWGEPHNGFPAYTLQPYTGPNPHSDHVHVSVRRANQGDARPWHLELGDQMVTRNDKADDGLPGLAAGFKKLIAAGVFTADTQPGGVTFNDELGAFLLRFESYLNGKYDLEGTGGVTLAQVKALINESTVTAPE